MEKTWIFSVNSEKGFVQEKKITETKLEKIKRGLEGMGSDAMP